MEGIQSGGSGQKMDTRCKGRAHAQLISRARNITPWRFRSKYCYCLRFAPRLLELGMSSVAGAASSADSVMELCGTVDESGRRDDWERLWHTLHTCRCVR